MRMILLTTVILFGLGTMVYKVKIGIDERQDYLQALELDIANTKRDIAVLESEWAYLSRPERIMKLSGELLNMKPMARIAFYRSSQYQYGLVSRLEKCPLTRTEYLSRTNSKNETSVKKIWSFVLATSPDPNKSRQIAETRLLVSCFIAFALIIGIAARIIQLAESKNSFLVAENPDVLSTKRGRILDRDGQLLAAICRLQCFMLTQAKLWTLMKPLKN